jgi:hypothetical protein
LSEVETGENYTEQSENERIRKSNTILLVIGQTERQDPIEVLNNFDMLDRLGANEG